MSIKVLLKNIEDSTLRLASLESRAVCFEIFGANSSDIDKVQWQVFGHNVPITQPAVFDFYTPLNEFVPHVNSDGKFKIRLLLQPRDNLRLRVRLLQIDGVYTDWTEFLDFVARDLSFYSPFGKKRLNVAVGRELSLGSAKKEAQRSGGGGGDGGLDDTKNVGAVPVPPAPPPVIDVDPIDMESFPHFGIFLGPGYVPDTSTYVNDPVRMRPWVWSIFHDTQNKAIDFVSNLRNRIPDLATGRYHSGISANELTVPAPIGDPPFPILFTVPSNWLLLKTDGSFYRRNPGGNFNSLVVDLVQPAVRSFMISTLDSLSTEWDFVSIDEVIYKFSDRYNDIIYTPEQWYQGVYDFMDEYTQRRGQVGYKPFIVNVATRPEETYTELIPVVDGLLFEFALSNITSINPIYREQRTKAEFVAFRAVLDAGRTMVITNLNVWSDVLDQVSFSRPANAGIIFSAVVCLLRNVGDKFYYNPETNEHNDYSNYAFHSWWRDLGTPVSNYIWNGMIASREFQNGTISLDISRSRPVVQIDSSSPNFGAITVFSTQ